MMIIINIIVIKIIMIIMHQLIYYWQIGKDVPYLPIVNYLMLPDYNWVTAAFRCIVTM